MDTNSTVATDVALHLVLGGARSGKSRYGEAQAQQASHSLGKPVVYVATAQALDEEMQQRIALHQQHRLAHWITIEEPLALASCLAKIREQYPQHPVLVDCLTLWVSNCLLVNDQDVWPQAKQALLAELAHWHGPLFLISNEVGQGIVPLGELSRRFVDESGWLHQDIAKQASSVTLVVAGIPMAVKRPNHEKVLV